MTDTEKRIKNIMNYHLHWNTAKSNAIAEIIWEIANNNERDLLDVCSPSKELEEKATELYNKYKENYYKELEEKFKGEERQAIKWKERNKILQGLL